MASEAPPPPPPTLIDTLGEEIVRIIAPVSICMLIVVLLVASLSTPFTFSPFPSITESPSSSSSWQDNLSGALLNALIFTVVITALTFLLVLLFYLRLTAFLRYYTAFSAFVIFLFMGGQLFALLTDRFNLSLDLITFSVLLFNFSVTGAVTVFVEKGSVPILLAQGYLVLIGVLVAFWFTMLPEWTTWTVLIAMAIYDLAAVLLPIGPLRLLVELAISRDEDIPALVYEARPVIDPQQNTSQRRRIWRNPDIGDEISDQDLNPESRIALIGENSQRNTEIRDAISNQDPDSETSTASIGENPRGNSEIGDALSGQESRIAIIGDAISNQDPDSVSSTTSFAENSRGSSESGGAVSGQDSGWAAIITILGEAFSNQDRGNRRNAEIGDAITEEEPNPETRISLIGEDSGGSISDQGSNLETRIALVGEDSQISALRTPLIAQSERESSEEVDWIGLSSSGAIKLGLGDFIFYSVLVGRAAMYDFIPVYACYLAIIAGLGVTLLLLGLFRRALPALPISIALGGVFYLLARFLLEEFLVQCSVNLVMF